MLSVPGGGGGGIQGGGAVDPGDNCFNGGGSGRGGLTQQFLPNGSSKMTAAAAAAAATRETPSSLKPPALSTPPSPTPTSLVKRPADQSGGNPLSAVTLPPPPATSAQVKLTPAESHIITPHSPPPPPPPPSSDLDNGTKPDGEDNVEDDDDNVNNNTVVDHRATPPDTSTKATVDGGEQSGGGGGGGPVRNLRVRGQRKFLPEKTRHKRQTLQDMTRPLKQWLIRHKDNPYPSKAQKMDLVSKSQMTLTQVSNWFANARRRLKNTVKQPELSWASRIKLYNSCVEGNAELFSLCSDDSCLDSEDDMMEHRQSDTFHDDVTDSLTSSRTATPDVTGGSGEACSSFNHGSSSGSHNNNNHHHHHHHSYHHSHSNSSSNSGPSPSGPSGPHPCPGLEDSCASFPKYKHSILHRYLSDSHQQALILDEDSVAKSRDRHHSSSTGSRDFEELSTSSVSSPAHESVHHDHLDDFSEEFETMALRRRTSDISSSSAREEDMYWKEIGAALALTSLAKGRVVRI